MKRWVRRWGIGTFVCIVIFIVAITALKQWAGNSSDGTVHVGKPTAKAAAIAAEPVTVETTYFSTLLPTGFTIKRQAETPGSRTQLQLLASSGTNDRHQFAITVGVLPSEGLQGVGDYNLRTSKPLDYERFWPDALPAGATAFRSTSGAAAFVTFWPHGGQYAEIALTSDGAATMSHLQNTYDQVMGSWQWK